MGSSRGGPAYGNATCILEEAENGLEIPQTHGSPNPRIGRKLGQTGKEVWGNPVSEYKQEFDIRSNHQLYSIEMGPLVTGRRKHWRGK